MKTSQNGWPVIDSVVKCKQWHIPDTDIILPLRKGAAGFILIHMALWMHEEIEPLDASRGDDFGWSYRKIAGSNTWSNHASGTAMDLNAAKHPQGEHTYPAMVSYLIRERLAQTHYGNSIKWGGDFTTLVDEMHFEIREGFDAAQVMAIANVLRDTKRGIRILEVN